MGALQVGEGEEAGTERDGDAVVRVAAEDAHEQHQKIAIFEIFVGYAVVLGDEEWDDAGRPQLHHGGFVAVEKLGGAGAEEQDEQCRAEHSRDIAGGTGDVSGEVDQEGEQQGCHRIDEFWLPEISAGFREEHQHAQGDEEDDKIGQSQFHAS